MSRFPPLSRAQVQQIVEMAKPYALLMDMAIQEGAWADTVYIHYLPKANENRAVTTVLVTSYHQLIEELHRLYDYYRTIFG